MAGGDGSPALVADVVRTHDVAFVCVPAGTRNTSRSISASTASTSPAPSTPRARRSSGESTSPRSATGSSSTTRRPGRPQECHLPAGGVRHGRAVRGVPRREARDHRAHLPDLLGPGAKRFDLRFDGPNGEPATSADMLLVSNDVYRLDSMSGFGTRPRIDDGLLGVVTVNVNRASDIPALVTAEATGRIRRFRGYRAWSTREFVVDSSEPLIDVGVDGEALCLPPPLRFRSLPGILRVRTPTSAADLSPAAAAPPPLGEVVPALLRVLCGRPAR
jgi:hypothetical protein